MFSKFWAAWIAVGIIAEALAIVIGRTTLSKFWGAVRDGAPAPVAVALGALLGALFLWLFGAHWLMPRLDRPGFNGWEAASVFLGAALGAIGVAFQRSAKKDQEDVT